MGVSLRNVRQVTQEAVTVVNKHADSINTHQREIAELRRDNLRIATRLKEVDAQLQAADAQLRRLYAVRIRQFVRDAMTTLRGLR